MMTCQNNNIRLWLGWLQRPTRPELAGLQTWPDAHRSSMRGESLDTKTGLTFGSLHSRCGPRCRSCLVHRDSTGPPGAIEGRRSVMDRRNFLKTAFGGLALCVGSVGVQTVTTKAAELQVYVPGAVRPAVLKVATIFQSETGHTISFTFGTGGGILEQVAAGALADVTVLPSSGLAKLERQGLVATQLEVGSLGIGVGVRRGAARPQWRCAGLFIGECI